VTSGATLTVLEPATEAVLDTIPVAGGRAFTVREPFGVVGSSSPATAASSARARSTPTPR
jgi:hypothetical protein